MRITVTARRPRRYPAIKINARQRIVLRAIGEHGGTLNEIAERMGEHPHRTLQTMAALHRKGLVCKPDHEWPKWNRSIAGDEMNEAVW